MTIEEQQKQLDFAIALYGSSTDIDGCFYAAELVYQILKLGDIKQADYSYDLMCGFKDIYKYISDNSLEGNYIIEALSYNKLKIIIDAQYNRKIKLNPNYKEDAD